MKRRGYDYQVEDADLSNPEPIQKDGGKKRKSFEYGEGPLGKDPGIGIKNTWLLEKQRQDEERLRAERKGRAEERKDERYGERQEGRKLYTSVEDYGEGPKMAGGERTPINSVRESAVEEAEGPRRKNSDGTNVVPSKVVGKAGKVGPKVVGKVEIEAMYVEVRGNDKGEERSERERETGRRKGQKEGPRVVIEDQSKAPKAVVEVVNFGREKASKLPAKKRGTETDDGRREVSGDQREDGLRPAQTQQSELIESIISELRGSDIQYNKEVEPERMMKGKEQPISSDVRELLGKQKSISNQSNDSRKGYKIRMQQHHDRSLSRSFRRSTSRESVERSQEEASVDEQEAVEKIELGTAAIKMPTERRQQIEEKRAGALSESLRASKLGVTPKRDENEWKEKRGGPQASARTVESKYFNNSERNFDEVPDSQPTITVSKPNAVQGQPSGYYTEFGASGLKTLAEGTEINNTGKGKVSTDGIITDPIERSNPSRNNYGGGKSFEEKANITPIESNLTMRNQSSLLEAADKMKKPKDRAGLLNKGNFLETEPPKSNSKSQAVESSPTRKMRDPREIENSTLEVAKIRQEYEMRKSNPSIQDDMLDRFVSMFYDPEFPAAPGPLKFAHIKENTPIENKVIEGIFGQTVIGLPYIQSLNQMTESGQQNPGTVSQHIDSEFNRISSTLGLTKKKRVVPDSQKEKSETLSKAETQDEDEGLIKSFASKKMTMRELADPKPRAFKLDEFDMAYKEIKNDYIQHGVGHIMTREIPEKKSYQKEPETVKPKAQAGKPGPVAAVPLKKKTAERKRVEEIFLKNVNHREKREPEPIEVTLEKYGYSEKDEDIFDLDVTVDKEWRKYVEKDVNKKK